MKEEIKKILKDKCDFIIQEKEVDYDLLRHWKLAGIIKSNMIQQLFYGYNTTSLKIILDSGNIMWTEKFQLALISSNIFDEIIVLINPGESDFYALTDYEDIITLLNTEFISPYLESEQPSLKYTIDGTYTYYDKDTLVDLDNFGNYSINTTATTPLTPPNLTNYVTSNTTLNNLDLQNYCSITSDLLLNNAAVSDSTAKNTNYTFKVKK